MINNTTGQANKHKTKDDIDFSNEVIKAVNDFNHRMTDEEIFNDIKSISENIKEIPSLAALPEDAKEWLLCFNKIQNAIPSNDIMKYLFGSSESGRALLRLLARDKSLRQFSDDLEDISGLSKAAKTQLNFLISTAPLQPDKITSTLHSTTQARLRFSDEIHSALPW